MKKLATVLIIVNLLLVNAILVVLFIKYNINTTAFILELIAVNLFTLNVYQLSERYK